MIKALLTSREKHTVIPMIQGDMLLNSDDLMKTQKSATDAPLLFQASSGCPLHIMTTQVQNDAP